MRELFITSILALGFFHSLALAQESTLEVKYDTVSWQCAANDTAKIAFFGKESSGRPIAELSAIANCQGSSLAPETCFIQKCTGVWECNSKACRK